MMTERRQDALTDREAEIVALVAQGLSNAAIAERLTIQVSTVNSHVHRALEKLGCHNRVELARWYLQHGQHPAATAEQPRPAPAFRLTRLSIAAAAAVFALAAAVVLSGQVSTEDGPPAVPADAVAGPATPTPAPTPVPTWAPGGGVAGARQVSISLPGPAPFLYHRPALLANRAVYTITHSYTYQAWDTPSRAPRERELVTESLLRVPTDGVPIEIARRTAPPGAGFGLAHFTSLDGCGPADSTLSPDRMVERLPWFVDIPSLRAEGYRPGGSLPFEAPALPDERPTPLQRIGAGIADAEVWSLVAELDNGGHTSRVVAFDPESGLLLGAHSTIVDRDGRVLSETAHVRRPVAVYDFDVSLDGLGTGMQITCEH